MLVHPPIDQRSTIKPNTNHSRLSNNTHHLSTHTSTNNPQYPTHPTTQLKFHHIYNDSSTKNLIELMQLKSIIAKELPKMPRQYIVKVLMDGTHQVIIAKNQEEKIIGGVCFRSFQKKSFIEVVFMVVQGKFKGKGMGSKIINYLKDKTKKQKIGLILTYADNTAVEFFRKMGFEAAFQTPDKEWSGFIKAYLEGTLMQCRIYGQMQYESFKSMIQRHRRVLINKIKDRDISFKYKGQSMRSFLSKPTYHTASIPGITEARWSSTHQQKLQTTPEFSFVLQQLYTIESLKKLPGFKFLRGYMKIAQTYGGQCKKVLINWFVIQKMILNGGCFKNSGDLRKAIQQLIESGVSDWDAKSVQSNHAQSSKQKAYNILQCLMARQIVIRVQTLFKEKQSRINMMANKKR